MASNRHLVGLNCKYGAPLCIQKCVHPLLHLPDAKSWPTVYYSVQSTIKMKRGSQGKKQFTLVWATLIPPHANFTVTWKRLMHGAHYHLISIQSSQLKLYSGCISLPELGAICRPLSSYLYQRRCFRGEHLGLRRQSMKWNAPGSPLCRLSKKGQKVFERRA